MLQQVRVKAVSVFAVSRNSLAFVVGRRCQTHEVFCPSVWARRTTGDFESTRGVLYCFASETCQSLSWLATSTIESRRDPLPAAAAVFNRYIQAE